MFIAALFTTANYGTCLSAHQLMDKENVVDTHNGVLLSHKKE
jgi:hypothetical protein